MSVPPLEPDAFASAVAQILRDLHPAFEIRQPGGRELLVNGRRLDLENLHRMVTGVDTDWTTVTRQFLGQMFSEESLHAADLPLDFVRPRIMPRIQPESIFDRLSREQVAHVPYVNGTVIVFVTDLPTMTVSITTEQAVRWNITPDELEDIARRNLAKYAPELEIQQVTSKEGGKAAVLGQHDGYDAARLLLDSLYLRLAPQLGGDFLVATPARDMFVAMSIGPNDFVERLKSRVAEDFDRLPYPITKELFYVTRDGVAGTGTAA